jgi:hypothetical protein
MKTINVLYIPSSAVETLYGLETYWWLQLAGANEQQMVTS